MTGRRAMGVEEEFLLVDPRDGTVRALAPAALAAEADRAAGGSDRVSPDRDEDRAADRRTDRAPDGDGDPGTGAGDALAAELYQQQVETATEPRETLEELEREIRAARERADESARRVGARVVALGTPPLPVDTVVTETPRYRHIRERFGLLAAEQLTCGCHVHVDVSSDEEGVAVLDRLRPWSAVLLALSANSPFWQGRDSAHDSYRSRVWSRWPSAGPTELFGTPTAYHDTVRLMVDSGTVLDDGMVYFEARLARDYPTVELRMADVCLRAGDAVLLAALSRALVATAAEQWRAGVPAPAVRIEPLRLASWRAARSGVDGQLLDPRTWRPAPAERVVGSLLEHVRDALEDTGDHAQVRERCAEVLGRGTGARRQREVHRRSGRLAEVVADAVRHTRDG